MSERHKQGKPKAQVRRDREVTRSGRPSLRIEALHAAAFQRVARPKTNVFGLKFFYHKALRKM